MNGEPLPIEHGFPLCATVPGYGAVRNVKWIKMTELPTKESGGA
jgi:sulfite oxidase